MRERPERYKNNEGQEGLREEMNKRTEGNVKDRR